jgi:hypothetical protein
MSSVFPAARWCLLASLLHAGTPAAAAQEPPATAGQCPAVSDAQIVPGGLFACISGKFYRCDHGVPGGRWVYVGPSCPHLDPLPGQARPMPQPDPQ